MGLFDTTKRRNLEALEREILANPTPQGMVTLIERYMAAGEETRAGEVAKRAIDKFPESERCRMAYQAVRKVQLQSEIQDLNRSLRSKPTVGGFERLAALYHRDLGNAAKAYETVTEGLSKFSSSDGLHLVAGEIRMERFHQDFLGGEFEASVRHLLKSLEANPRGTRALVLLGRLYAEAGAYGKAQGYLREVLKQNPGDAACEALLKLLEELLPSEVPLEDALLEIESRRGLGPAGTRVREVFEPRSKGGLSASFSMTKVQQFLSGLQLTSGYRCSAVLGRDGQPMAAHSKEVLKGESFSKLLQEIYRCADESSRKMGIGAFVGSEIETSIGRVQVSECRGTVVGFLVDPQTRKEDVDGMVEKFVSFLSVG